ncbi:MAG: PLP-dependent transferase [Spirochaetia bacterium]|jgi:cystathionine beta-lyase/cystathionine gamma-synthase
MALDKPGEAVGGDYSITGTLPTLADVIAFKEGTAELDFGYYRFISPPRLRRLEEALKNSFHCRHCRLTESFEIALLELVLCLHKPGTKSRIIILKEKDAAPPFTDNTFLPACDRDGVVVQVIERADEIPLDLGRDDAVVAVVRSRGGQLPQPPSDVSDVRFFVLGLAAGKDAVQAGAVLGNADRAMDRLAEQMRRRGPILSSRSADCLLGGTGSQGSRSDPAVSRRVAKALCRLEGGSHAFLHASGMSAITRVLDVLRRPGRSQIVAVGHLYNDTFNSLRLAPRLENEAPNAFLGVDELDRLDALVTDQTAAILTETITNPLSDVPDLALLSGVARAHGIPLVVDNTIATPENCHPFDLGADYVVHSTTKYLNGRNDHAGGAVIVRDAQAARLLADCQGLLNDQMSPREAEALEGNLGSLGERMCRFNENALRVASFLAEHRGVQRVFFNGLQSHRSYATARRILRGPGSVISFVLKRNSLEGLRAFYDSPLSGIIKAPSLGSDLTLLCPYTLLTHYDDTDEELAEIGLPRFLVRIAVGCEKDITPVLESLQEALQRQAE